MPEVMGSRPRSHRVSPGVCLPPPPCGTWPCLLSCKLRTPKVGLWSELATLRPIFRICGLFAHASLESYHPTPPSLVAQVKGRGGGSMKMSIFWWMHFVLCVVWLVTPLIMIFDFHCIVFFFSLHFLLSSSVRLVFAFFPCCSYSWRFECLSIKESMQKLPKNQFETYVFILPVKIPPWPLLATLLNLLPGIWLCSMNFH